MRILLVEDDALLGDGLRAGLQQSAFAVDWVRDGPSAEEALRTNPYAAAVPMSSENTTCLLYTSRCV